jgi:hypothetical protein
VKVFAVLSDSLQDHLWPTTCPVVANTNPAGPITSQMGPTTNQALHTAITLKDMYSPSRHN